MNKPLIILTFGLLLAAIAVPAFSDESTDLYNYYAEGYVDTIEASDRGDALIITDDQSLSNYYYDHQEDQAKDEQQKKDSLYHNKYAGMNYWDPANSDYYHRSSLTDPSSYYNSRPLYDSYHYKPTLSPTTYNTYHHY